MTFITRMPSRDSRGAMQQALAATPAARDGELEQGLSPAVALARAGDPAALEQLTREQLPRVERLLRRLLGRREDMEDLVQTVFLEMCRALPGFRGQSTISTFVGGITVQVARRAMRPSAWWRLRGAMPEQPTASGPEPERAAAVSEQLRRVHGALSGISPDKRIAFSLWALEGMDVASIAETMGASISATRSRIFYAQKELKTRAAADPYLREFVEESDVG
jgi:RNA polymerase sigma-70 factor (ECF subfamily)